MNERIQELAKEAGFRADVTVFDANSNPIVTITEERLEKFAELIVRECASQVVINEALNIFEHFDLE